LRNTNWRRYRQENEGNDSVNELDQDEDDKNDDTEPGAVRIAGPRADLYNDDNTIVIGTINGDDQSNTSRNTMNPMTRQTQHLMDTSVPTAEVTPANKPATETTGGRYIWICLCALILVVGAAAGVAFGLTGGKDGVKDGSPVAPTDSPTSPECSGFGWIDPDIENMDEKTFARYSDLLPTLVPELVPDYSEPMKAQEYCTSAHLALVWLASDDLDSEYPQKVLENRFLLAFLFVEWEGYNWLGNSTGWLSESPECDWSGISCDEFGSIYELDVTSKIKERSLRPFTMPSEIGLFTDLSKLSAIHWTRFLQGY
jgi:hypothetical protein